MFVSSGRAAPISMPRRSAEAIEAEAGVAARDNHRQGYDDAALADDGALAWC